MNDKKRQLDQLHKFANEKQELAAKKLAAAQQVHEKNQLQLDDLLRYQQSYRERLKTENQEVISSDKLHHHYAFIQSLERAIKQQYSCVFESKKVLQDIREHWQQEYQSASALGQLVSRMDQQALNILREKENRANDEHNIQRFQSNK